MRFSISDVYLCTPERFWGEVFFTEAYTTPLYREGLGFERIEYVLDETAPGGERRRQIRVKPHLDAPAAVRKLIGEALTYVEEGRFTPEDGHFLTRIVPSRLTDKVSIAADMWLVPRVDGNSDRKVEFTVDVRLLGLGGVMERFIEKTLRENYAKAVVHTNRFLAG